MTATAKEWVWMDPAAFEAIHDAQLAEHGRLTGRRDACMLASALARPQNLALDGAPDLAAFAASYGYGISRNRAFIEGNKRTGFVAADLFCVLNGF